MPSGSGVIIGNLAKQFAADEMILAGERPFKRPAVTWRAEWPQITYIAHEWPPTWRGSRWWRRLQLPLMLWRCIRLVKRSAPSSILVVFPNEEFLLIGYLTSLIGRLPLFAYFHNTYIENRRGLALDLARWLQTRVFSRARHVFLMSEGMVELYRKRYPQVQCSALLHSFNESVPEYKSLPEIHSPVRITICGNINETCRDATVRFSKAMARIKGIALTFLSATPRRELIELGLLQNGARHQTVSRDEVIDRLQEADIVVLPHGFTGNSSPDEYRTIFPTKTIEYLICGRPILAHTPPDCYLTRFLRNHQCALIVDTPCIAALVEAVEKLRDDHELRSKLVTAATRTAELFHAPRVANGLRLSLEGNYDARST